MTGATVKGAAFSSISLPQLYSTASYQAHDLAGIGLGNNNLTGANLTGQKLTNASFYEATLIGVNISHANLTGAYFAGYQDEYGSGYGADLTNANLTAADARNANFSYTTLTGVNTSNLIQTDGHIAGLDLRTSNSLVVRNYRVPIAVDQYLSADASGALRLNFDADPWGSTISFAPAIPVALGGTLELAFASGVDPATQLGRTIDLFDWTGVTPTGAFNVVSPFAWDLSQLYTTGEVTLTAAGGLVLGDFNGDSVVNADDLASWKNGFGTSGNATLTQGDADGDQDIDGADFLAWQRRVSSASSVSTNAAVPEPEIFATLASAALATILRRRSAVAKTHNFHGCNCRSHVLVCDADDVTRCSGSSGLTLTMRPQAAKYDVKRRRKEQPENGHAKHPKKRPRPEPAASRPPGLRHGRAAARRG
jgi:uncharacterized protein YjbI with pentapeptide repeats